MKIDGTNYTPVQITQIADKPAPDTASFSVQSPIEDYLPQGKHISTKKSFKSLREYIGYMLLLSQKYDDLRPALGNMDVKLEDRKEFAALRHEIETLSQSDILA